MEKEEYIKPQTVVVLIDHDELLLDDFKVSNHQGYGGPTAKPYDDEWLEDEDGSFTNKWENLVPSNLPGTWQPVGE